MTGASDPPADRLTSPAPRPMPTARGARRRVKGIAARPAPFSSAATGSRPERNLPSQTGLFLNRRDSSSTDQSSSRLPLYTRLFLYRPESSSVDESLPPIPESSSVDQNPPLRTLVLVANLPPVAGRCGGSGELRTRSSSLGSRQRWRPDCISRETKGAETGPGPTESPERDSALPGGPLYALES